jgi:lysophospholipase
LRSYIEQKNKPVVGLCLSSPALGIKNPPSAAKESLAQFTNKYLPRLTLANDINYENLSQIPEQITSYEKDPLRHNKINSRTYIGMVESFDIIFNKSKKINLPSLFQLSENDAIVSAPESQRLFNQLEIDDKQLILYRKSCHEIFNDIEQEQAIKDLAQFINSHI